MSTIASSTAFASAAATPDFAELFAAQDRHFWFCARNRVLANVVQRITQNLADGFRVLEVGCGTGNVLRVLEQVCARGDVIGLDLHPQGLRLARQRTRCPLVAADIHQLPFRDPFDVVGMFDVLEHLPDDRRVLIDLRKALTAEGRLLLTVPAHAWLWSEVDVYSGHFRRYAPRQLSALLEECGFRVEYLTQFMAPLLPLMWLSRRGVSGAAATGAAPVAVDRQRVLGELRIIPVLNELLGALLALERPGLRHGLRLPFGTSLLAVARPC
jgi:SAM-dependent methyltransferase